MENEEYIESGLSVGTMKIANKYEIFTEEEIDAINNKIPELDKRVGVIEDEIEEINSSLDNITSKLNSYIYIADSEDLQEVINKALSLNNSTIVLKPKRYVLRDSLVVDISKIKIKGNGAILDFSQANDNISCIQIIGSKPSPYNQNGNFIEELEIVGSGKNNGQIGIEFCATSPNSATSHINLEKLNIYNFGTGIKYTKYCYLIRHMSVDIYNCNTCVHMPSGGQDYGENILFVGCTLYNSTLGVHAQNPNGDLRFTNCSLDYNSQMMKSNGGRIFFDNGHIEGKHIYECTVENGSYISVTNSALVMNNTDSTHIPFIANNDMFFDNNYITGGLYGSAYRTDLVQGSGIVKFTNSKSYITCDFFSHTLNDNSVTKIINNYECMVTHSTKDISSKWTSDNCNIVLDSENCLESIKSLKITKTWGVGSTCVFRIIIPVNSERFHILFDVLSSIEIPSDKCRFNVKLANIGGYEYNSKGYITPMIFEELQIGDFKPSLSTTYKTLHISTSQLKKPTKYNAVLLDVDMFYLEQCSLWFDNIKITSF